MKYRSLLVVSTLLLAGCNGVPVDSVDTAPSDSDSEWTYSIVVENGFDAQAYTLTLTTPSGATVLNKTRVVDSGERWVAATLTNAEHGGEEYVVTIRAHAEETQSRSTFDTKPQAKVTYTSGASLYRFGPGGSEVHICGESPDCYTNVTTG